MKPWTALVIAPPEGEASPLISRLPSYLHPVAGRPVIWHTVSALASHPTPPTAIRVLGSGDLPPDLFEGIGADIRFLPDNADVSDGFESELLEGRPVLVIHASAFLGEEATRRLVEADDGEWIAGVHDMVAAVRLHPRDLLRFLDSGDPLRSFRSGIDPQRRILQTPASFIVQTRADLARAHERIRDELVDGLMQAGVTFILPESVVVDVDVRIGRDTIVYPSVVIEGQTTVGQETVIGPGCRIMNSWIGSGVELKGWNYIANTSIRNRAILEPYVRRGFD